MSEVEILDFVPIVYIHFRLAMLRLDLLHS